VDNASGFARKIEAINGALPFGGVKDNRYGQVANPN
jgi:hypothetical protein